MRIHIMDIVHAYICIYLYVIYMYIYIYTYISTYIYIARECIYSTTLFLQPWNVPGCRGAHTPRSIRCSTITTTPPPAVPPLPEGFKWAQLHLYRCSHPCRVCTHIYIYRKRDRDRDRKGEAMYVYTSSSTNCLLLGQIITWWYLDSQSRRYLIA